MKSIRNYILMATLILSAGCSDMLDVKPTTFISDEAIWEDANLINQICSQHLRSMLCGFNRCTAGYGQTWSMSWAGNLDAATDDFASVADSPYLHPAQQRRHYSTKLSFRRGNMDPRIHRYT